MHLKSEFFLIIKTEGSTIYTLCGSRYVPCGSPIQTAQKIISDIYIVISLITRTKDI